MAERNGFIVHEESYRSFERLSDERLGKLFRAMYQYASGEPAHTFPEDEVLDIIFENIRERMDRDAVRYEETCKARSEAGKKGGRPKKANGFSEKAKKANGFFEKQTKAKKAKCECDSDCDRERDPECEHEPDPVCDRECDARAREERHTAHTARQMTLQEVIALAAQFGYSWDEAEARGFLAFNIDKGRETGWGFAVQKWEENRIKRQHGSDKKPTQREIDEMNDYLSVVNQFPKEGET